MKILVIDDEPEILTIVTKWLARKGHDAITTSDADQALNLIQEHDFNAVITDLILPRASGLALISKIHEKRPRLPTIVMSVIEDTRVAVLAAQEGIEGYLTKPIEFEKLDELLKQIQTRA